MERKVKKLYKECENAKELLSFLNNAESEELFQLANIIGERGKLNNPLYKFRRLIEEIAVGKENYEKWLWGPD